jgi:hypothetical protein
MSAHVRVSAQMTSYCPPAGFLVTEKTSLRRGRRLRHLARREDVPGGERDHLNGGGERRSHWSDRRSRRGTPGRQRGDGCDSRSANQGQCPRTSSHKALHFAAVAAPRRTMRRGNVSA